MERTSFYSSNPFIFDINENFNLLFSPKLTSDEKQIFRIDQIIRKNVQKAFISLINKLGFDYDNDIGIIQISHDFEELTPKKYYKMLLFFKQIKMNYLSHIFLLIRCATGNKIPSKWIKLQNLPPFPTLEKTSPILKKFNALSYSGNSCYLDSTLLSLLLSPNPVITKYIFKKTSKRMCDDSLSPEDNQKYIKEIKKELINISDFFHTENETKNCDRLRQTFQKCKGSQPFHRSITQDAGEFLMYIFKLFGMNDICTETIYNYGSNKYDTDHLQFVSKRKEKTSPIIQIVESLLIKLDQNRTYSITEFIKQIDVTFFDKKNVWKPDNEGLYTKKTSIIKRNINIPFAVFYVKRLVLEDDERVFYKTRFFPTETLFTLNYSQLHLSSIVIHHEDFAHYTSVIKYDGIWYYYNDISSKLIKKIGSFDDMLKSKPNPITHGTLYFYS